MLKPLHYWEPDEKLEAFDWLHAKAMEEIAAKQETGEVNKDFGFAREALGTVLDIGPGDLIKLREGSLVE